MASIFRVEEIILARTSKYQLCQRQRCTLSFSHEPRHNNPQDLSQVIWEAKVQAHLDPSIFDHILELNAVSPAYLLVLAEIISSTLKMEAICSSETSVATEQTTRHHIPEDDTLFSVSIIRLSVEVELKWSIGLSISVSRCDGILLGHLVKGG
jgi:hypothetical protein